MMHDLVKILFVLTISGYCSTKVEDTCPYGTFLNGSDCEVCGQNNIRNMRIVGGIEVKPHSFPSQVLIVQRLIVDSRGSKIRFNCGGTLINLYTIVTAAHCILNYNQYYESDEDGRGYHDKNIKKSLESTFTIYLGAHNISFLSNETNMPSTVIKASVEKVIKHEQYDKVNRLNDIAILILSERVNINEFISPACLPSQVSDTYPDENTPIFVVGWGQTKEYGSLSNSLLYAKLKAYNFDLCSNTLPNRLKNENSQVCVGYYFGNQDSCEGDSGGAGYVYERISEQNRIILSAIVSYGEGCGVNKTLALYTRVGHYLDWIKEHWKID